MDWSKQGFVSITDGQGRDGRKVTVEERMTGRSARLPDYTIEDLQGNALCMDDSRKSYRCHGAHVKRNSARLPHHVPEGQAATRTPHEPLRRRSLARCGELRGKSPKSNNKKPDGSDDRSKKKANRNANAKQGGKDKKQTTAETATVAEAPPPPLGIEHDHGCRRR